MSAAGKHPGKEARAGHGPQVEQFGAVLRSVLAWHEHAAADEHAVIWNKVTNRHVKFRPCTWQGNPDAALLELTSAFPHGPVDIFCSVNGLLKPWPKDKLVARLNALWVDLDFYKKYETIAPREMWAHLLALDYFSRIGIPEPGEVICSGNGLYLLWPLDGPDTVAYRPNLELFRRCQQRLVDLFAEYGADAGATNPARILRPPGSINGKRNHHVESIGGSKDTFTPAEMASNLGVRVQAPKRPATSDKVQPQSNLARLPIKFDPRQFGSESLNHQRFLDLWDLNSLRRGIKEGQRHFALLYFITTCRALRLPESAAHAEAQGLNQRFDPPQSRVEAQRLVSSVYVRSSAPRVTNRTIIRNLGITAAEQRRLRTIIGRAEKEARLLAKLMASPCAAAVRRALEATPTTSVRQIARQLRIPRSTVGRIVWAIKKDQPNQRVKIH